MKKIVWCQLLITLAFSNIALSKIDHFTEVGAGIYRGSKPFTKGDFSILKEKGIKTILSLRLGLSSSPIFLEKRMTLKHGFKYFNARILPSIIQPSKKEVVRALSILNQSDLRPIYIHCLLGEDRTSLIVALYRIHVLGWSVEKAREEMKTFNFKEHFFAIAGLISFFEKYQLKGSLDLQEHLKNEPKPETIPVY